MWECKEAGKSEYIELKSRFIGYCFSAQDQNSFDLTAENLKIEHPSASHLVYATRWTSEHQLFEKYSDDREPFGTAGIPLLSLLQKRSFMNTAIIVIRYFGGIKLGKKHLLSAYLRTGAEACQKAIFSERKRGYTLTIQTDYEVFPLLEKWLLEHEAIIQDRCFSQDICINVWMSISCWDRFQDLAFKNRLRISSMQKRDML